jgi:hypothetical protein
MASRGTEELPAPEEGEREGKQQSSDDNFMQGI